MVCDNADGTCPVWHDITANVHLDHTGIINALVSRKSRIHSLISLHCIRPDDPTMRFEMFEYDTRLAYNLCHDCLLRCAALHE